MHPTKRNTFLLLLIGSIIVLSLFVFEMFAANLTMGIHHTADDASYMRPAENWINNGVWKDNSIGASSYVQRPPLLGLIHLIAYSISPSIAPLLLFVISFAAHLLALYLLIKVLRENLPERSAFIFALIYGSMPLFFGFLSYQITEAFAGSFLIIGIFLFTRKEFPLYKASLFLISLALFRPLLLLLFLPFFIQLILKRTGKSALNWKQISLLSLAFLSIFGWELRKHHYIGEWFNPHPIYHASNESQYRPLHEKFSNLFRVWESRPEQFHTLMGSAWSNEPIQKKSIIDYCQQRNVPLSASTLFTLLKHYQKINIAVQNVFKIEKTRRETAEEIHLGNQIQQLTIQLEAGHPYEYWIVTPFNGMREQVVKSHLNLAVFQDKYRGTFWVESLRIVSLFMVLFIYTSLFISLFKRNKWQFFAIGGLIYFNYLFWVQRMNEDRYLQPLLCFSYVLAALTFHQMIVFLHKKRSTKSTS